MIIPNDLFQRTYFINPTEQKKVLKRPFSVCSIAVCIHVINNVFYSRYCDFCIQARLDRNSTLIAFIDELIKICTQIQMMSPIPDNQNHQNKPCNRQYKLNFRTKQYQNQYPSINSGHCPIVHQHFC